MSLFVYKGSLFSVKHCLKKEIITLEDLTTEENGANTGFQIMASASFSPKEKVSAYGDYRRNSYTVATSFENVQ